MAASLTDTGIVQVQSTDTEIIDDPGQAVVVAMTISNDSASDESFALHRGAAGFTPDASNRICNIQGTLAPGEFFSLAVKVQSGDQLRAICGTDDAVNVTYEEISL